MSWLSIVLTICVMSLCGLALGVAVVVLVWVRWRAPQALANTTSGWRPRVITTNQPDVEKSEADDACTNRAGYRWIGEAPDARESELVRRRRALEVERGFRTEAEAHLATVMLAYSAEALLPALRAWRARSDDSDAKAVVQGFILGMQRVGYVDERIAVNARLDLHRHLIACSGCGALAVAGAACERCPSTVDALAVAPAAIDVEAPPDHESDERVPRMNGDFHAHQYRDHGQFGSMPLYDGMGDEDGAEVDEFDEVDDAVD